MSNQYPDQNKQADSITRLVAEKQAWREFSKDMKFDTQEELDRAYQEFEKRYNS